MKRPIYIRNVVGFFNKEKSIEHMVKVNIYYQGHRKRTEINVIRGQKWSVKFGMPWLIYYNPETDCRIKEVKVTRYLKECGKQGKPG